MPAKTFWLSHTKFRKAYMDARARCYDKKNKEYVRYWGRWIKVLWKNFDEFYYDMYKSYIRHVKKYWEKQTTLDRYPNMNGDYCKKNCRWATIWQQQRNRRSTRIIKFRWKKMCLTDRAETLWIKRSTLSGRLNLLWWTIKEALTSKKFTNQNNTNHKKK